jgi:DNA-binding MarR family transcriptional regulator
MNRKMSKAPPVGVAFLLSQVGAHAAVAFAGLLRPLKLTPQDAGVLRLLGSNPGLNQHLLSDLLGMFPSRLVGLLDGLERRQLIERCDSPSDRRSYALHLTRAGRGELATISRVTRQLEDDLCGALSDLEKDTLAKWLRRIVSQQQITPGVHPAYRQLAGKKGTRT